MNYSVYFLIDDVNKTIRYVGYTSQTLKRRLNSHIKDSLRFNHYRACWIRSLLENNITPRIKLFKCFSSKEQALLTEIALIKELRLRGYGLVNASDGGEGNSGYVPTREQRLALGKKIKQYSIDGILLNIYDTIADAARALRDIKCNPSIVSCCKGKFAKKTFKGFVWRYFEDEFDKYSVNKDYSHNSTLEHREAIRKSKLGCGNPMFGKVGSLNPAARAIVQKDLNGNIIAKFSSLSQTKGIISRSTLNKCLRKGKVWNNCIWEYL